MHAFIYRTITAALVISNLALAQGTYTTFGAGCPGSSTVAYCGIDSNGTATFVTTSHTGFKNIYALQVPNSAASLTVAGFELLSQRVITPSVLPVAILDSTSTGRPGAVLATGSLTVSSNMGWHRFTLANPLTITTGRPFFLQVTGNQTCRFPLAPTGKTATYYLKTPSGTTFLGPYSALRWAWRLVCGRPGTAPKLINVPQTKDSVNGSASQNTAGTTNHIHTYALPVANSRTTLTIGGFELLTQTVVGASSTLPVEIRDSTSTGFPGPTLASGTMTVTSTLGWHRFTLKQPLTITSGRRLFIQYQGNTSVRFPLALNGTKSDHYLMQSGTSYFTGPYNNVLAWAWRVIGDPGPTLGNTFSVDLSSARPKADLFFIVGLSKTTWGGVNLPLDLKFLNAPGCTLLTSMDFMFAGKTNPAGAASFNLWIPNKSIYKGIRFYNQYAVSDTVNGFGVVLSNAGEGTIW